MAAKLVDGYLVKESRYGEIWENEKPDAHLEEKDIAIVFTEREAKDLIRLRIKSLLLDDSIEYNRRVISSGEGVCFTSIDPKKDGYSYRIYYNKCQVVIT